MIDFLVLVLAFRIIYIDIRLHKISNRSNLYFAISLIPEAHTLPIGHVFLCAIVSIGLFPLLRIGMGDLKLWLGMLISQGHILLTLEYLRLFVLVSTSVILIEWLRSGDRQGSVAFGPCLLCPFLLLYLGI